jgi:hypothetical protein
MQNYASYVALHWFLHYFDVQFAVEKIRNRMERCSILILRKSCQQTCMTYTIDMCTVINS